MNFLAPKFGLGNTNKQEIKGLENQKEMIKEEEQQEQYMISRPT